MAIAMEIEVINSHLGKASEEDLYISATLRTFHKTPKTLQKLLAFISDNLKEVKYRMLDLGCGYGFIAHLIGEILGFEKIYGADIDEKRLEVAKERLDEVLRSNLENEKLPFPDQHFDMVISFGVLEHLRFFDNTIKETYRVLKPEGLFVVSIPNLGDWMNRLRLLIGLQPHTVQISEFYAQSKIDHIHSCTLGTFRDLLEIYGFKIVKTYGLQAIFRSRKIFEFLDRILSKKPSLSIRFIVIAKKKTESVG